MNDLSKFLVEGILLGEASSVKDLVVVYSGRFQPFHKGHFATYQTLVKKFGKNNVYIGTSDKTDNQKSPFNFKEKVKVMTTMFGIPSNKIVQVKNPYAPSEILNKFNKETTAFITVVGEKDSNRLGGKYFEKYKDGIELEGYVDRGYVFISPAQPNAISGTDVRVGLRKGSTEDKKDFFVKKAYGKFNQSIFDMVVDKLSKLPEITESNIYIPTEIIESWLVDNLDLVVEATMTMGKNTVDDGPNFVFPSYSSFNKISKRRAERIGYTVLAQIMSDELTNIDPHPVYPKGPVKAVTPFPAGVIGKTTATNQKDYYGSVAYKKWLTHISRIAGMVGYSLVDSLDLNDDKKESLKTKKIPNAKLPKISEAITLDVEIGDTVLMGKFKNKKVIVKSIGKDEHGMPTINGKKVATFRMVNESNIFEDIVRLNNSLGIERDELPQIDKDQLENYLEYLESNDIQFEIDFKSVSSLNSSQTKVDLDKVENIMNDDSSHNSPIIVSKDDYILDGHHRALAAYNLDNQSKIPTIQIDLPIDELIEVSNDFNGSYNQSIDEEVLNENIIVNILIKAIASAGAVVVRTFLGMFIDRVIYGAMKTYQDIKDIVSPKPYIKFLKRLEKNDAFNKQFIEFAIQNKKGKNLIGNSWMEKIITLPAFVDEFDKFTTEEGIVGYNKTRLNTVIKKSMWDAYLRNWRGIYANLKKKYPQFANELPEGKLNEIPMADLVQIDRYADRQLNPVDVVITDKHFFDRLGDPRNKKPISAAELTGFFKRLAKNKKKFLDFINQYGQIVAKDNRTNINIPFMQQANKIIAKTIMRKDNYMTSNPIYKFEDICEASDIGGLGSGNNSARWTAPGQSKKLKIPQLSGYEQTHFPIADELDISKEKYNWDGVGKTKKYNNKIRAIRKDDGSLVFEDKIPGGLAQGLSLTDVAKHHNISVDVLVAEFKKGISVEMEHTTDREIAKEIALDHIYEDPKYYTKLATIEEDKSSFDRVKFYEEYYRNLSPSNFKVVSDDDEVRIKVPNRNVNEYKLESSSKGSMYDPKRIKAYYEALCKSEGFKPLPVKFGKVKYGGAVTVYNSKTMKPLYISFDVNRLSDPEFAIIHELTHQIKLETEGDAYVGKRDQLAKFKKLENRLVDKYVYSEYSKLLYEIKNKNIMDNTNEAYTKGNIFGGKIKIGGVSVPLEVELIGADNKKKVFITKVVHIDSKYHSKLPSNGILEIPARIFRTPGGGWYKIKTKSAFEGIGTGYPDQAWIDKHNVVLKKLRKKFDSEKQQYNEPYALSGGINERVEDGKVICDNCGWSWKISEGGSDTYMCHKCGTDNDPNLTEGLLTEGGAYGHMNHPFDTSINLTFGQLKNIVNLALEGKLELTREKTDGQALAISWVNGRLVAARNKGHLANRGEKALDITGVATKFAGRGELEKAYNFAMKDLSKAIKALSEKQREKIFKNGACFMNLEVIYPTSVNVIPYGQALLVFHGTMEYNEAGVAIGENQEAAKVLAGMIKQVNQNVQSAYTIQGPPVVKLPQSKNLTSLKGKYNGQITKLQSKFKLSDTDGIADYHQAWWTDFVTKKSPSPLDNRTLMGLVKRWAFYDKSFRLDNKNISDPKVLDWAKGIDKNDHDKIAKDNIRPFEDIFLGVGSEVLSFMSSVLTANPDSAVRAMKDRLDKTISDVKTGGDEKKIAKLKMELQRLNAIGGKNKIVPNEGIVFVYNGNTMKLTGTFAPLNQILGLFYE